MTKECPDTPKFDEPTRVPKKTWWYPAPKKFVDPNLSFKNPGGFAEIKPHNYKGLKEGMKDLKKTKGTRAGREPRFVVTYLPIKKGTTGENRADAETKGVPHCVRIFATPYDDTPGKRVTDRTWHNLGSFKTPPMVPPNVEEASLFGAAIEKYARELFRREILAKVTPTPKNIKGGETPHGADIYWDELARFYDELARELGDPFYADLASELVSLSREAARWDAA